jgi:DHA1 family tetracycline resistance protein-like MFS transporter
VRRQAALAFIFVTVVLDVLGFGVIVPVFPKLIETFKGGDTAAAARIYGVFGTVWALMQFVGGPLLGALSDRFGRRAVLLTSCFGLGLDYVLMALAPNLTWLFVGRVISGLTGAGFVTAYAYVADVLPPDKRTSGFGLVGAAWGVGFVVGPALGGTLGAIGPRLPFWTAAGLSFLSWIYGFFLLPESLPPERRESFAWRRANPVGSLTLLRSHPELLDLAGANLFYYVAHQVLPSVFVLYVGYRYGWDARAVGWTLAAVGVLNVLVQGTLVRPIVARFGERRALLTGLLAGTAGFVTFGVAPAGAWLWAGLPIFALMGLYGPSSQGLMTRLVSPSEQGKLQGANASLMGISGLIGPGLFTFAFSSFISRHDWRLPGAPWFLAGLMLLIAMALALRGMQRSFAGSQGSARPLGGPGPAE